MRTKWTAFDAKRMDEAKGYRMTNSGELITDVTKIGSVVAFLDEDGKFTYSQDPSGGIEMQVEDKIECPCLCWVSDGDKGVRLIRPVISIDSSDKYQHKTDLGSWKIAEPLTDDELSEFGLKLIDS